MSSQTPSRIRDAHQDVFGAQGVRSGTASAERLGYLQRLARRGSSTKKPIAIASLRHLTSFLMDQRHLGQPDIGVSPDGVALAQWRVTGNGVLANWSSSTRDLSGSRARQVQDSQDGESLRISGTLPKESKALQAIQSLLS